MLPTAPRRGCLAPSCRGLWRGAGRRVSSSAPGGARFEPVRRAAPCETAAHALVCGLGRAVSASQSGGIRDCRSVDFPHEDVGHTSPTPASVLRGVFCTCPARGLAVRLTYRVRARRTRRDTHWCVTELGNILPTLRTILLNRNQCAAGDIGSSKTASSVLQQALGRAIRRTAAQAA